MLVFSNAKINIGLNIVEKRNDGFHNLETIFYPIKLSDGLEIVESNSGFEFSNSGIVVDSTTENNLIVKAYNLLKSDFQLSDVKIHLHKIIPFGAGLGGGSSNAAFAIKTLNSVFSLQLSAEQMIEYAKKLGSDCAFFINNSPVFAFEKGDMFQEISLDLSKYQIILIKPNVNVSTKDAYSNVQISTPKYSLKESIKKPIEEWKNLIFNDFEKNNFPKFPIIEKIKHELYKQGAIYASMSGSGSSVFGIFKNTENVNINIDNTFIWKNDLGLLMR